MTKRTVWIDLGELGEVAVEVDYRYVPGRPGRMHDRHGDPGHPPEPAEVRVNAIKVISDIDALLRNHFENSESFQIEAAEIHAERLAA